MPSGGLLFFPRHSPLATASDCCSARLRFDFNAGRHSLALQDYLDAVKVLRYVLLDLYNGSDSSFPRIPFHETTPISQ